MAGLPSVDDVWYARLHLAFEFVITVLILAGSYGIVINTQTSPEADSGAAAICALVAGYWFGRASQRS